MINLKIFLVFIFVVLFNNKSFSINANFVIATVDRDPITYLDLIEKSKLKYFLYNKNNKFIDLKKYYKLALNDLISEKLLINHAIKSNKNILKLTETDAKKYLLERFNSKKKLEKFFEESGLSKKNYIYNIQIELVKKFLINQMFKKEFDDYLEEASITENKKNNINQLDLEQITVKIKEKNKNKINKLDKTFLKYLNYGMSYKDIAKILNKDRNLKVIAGRSGWQNETDLKADVFKKFFMIDEGDFVKEKTSDKLSYVRVVAKRVNGSKSKREKIIELIQINFNKKKFSKPELDDIINTYKLNKKVNNCKVLEKNTKNDNKIKTNYVKAELTNFSEKIINKIQNTKINDITKPITFNNETMVFYVCNKINQSKITKKIKLDEKKLNKKVTLLTQKIVKILKKDAIIDIKMKINDIK